MNYVTDSGHITARVHEILADAVGEFLTKSGVKS